MRNYEVKHCTVLITWLSVLRNFVVKWNTSTQLNNKSYTARKQFRHTIRWRLYKKPDGGGSSLEAERKVFFGKLEHGLVRLLSVNVGVPWCGSIGRFPCMYKIKLQKLGSNSCWKMAVLYLKSGSCFLTTRMGTWATGTMKVNDSRD